MTSCASCGHQLGVGRFCTNCGAPVDPGAAANAANLGAPTVATPTVGPADAEEWHTDTAERRLPTADPRTPPAAVAPPPPPRYPLYADEVVGYDASAPGPVVVPEPVQAPRHAEQGSAYEALMTDQGDPSLPEEDYSYEYSYEERRSPVLWILAAALVLVLVGAGWWFLVRDDGSGGHTDATTARSGTTGQSPAPKGEDVAGHASARAPKTAPPNEDVNGDQVSYDASNMLDGVPSTAWRAPGDASGMTLTFTLRAPTELHQVGLINGYAKSSVDAKGQTFDWYLGNRRIESVVWLFDDGTKVQQSLKDSQDLQLVDVKDVVTSKVQLKIVKVSKPGTGPAARDFTAISEVSLVGDPQG